MDNINVTVQQVFSTMMGFLMAKFMINDAPHALGLFDAERPKWYIMSKPPKKPFLYHHSVYTGLKQIAHEWAIRASPDKHVVSLTTDPGRFLSPMPILAAVTIDGVIKMPFTEELQQIAIPALYITRSEELTNKAKELGYGVFTSEQLPPEYKYIMRFVTHGDMFVDENEYVVIAEHVNVPVGSVIYIHPAKLKRFKAGLGKFAMQDIRSLEELATEVERE